MNDRSPNRRPPIALLAAALLGAASFAAAAAAQERPIAIAVVDLDRVVAQSAAGQALEARLSGFEREVKAQLAARQEAANDMRRRATEGAGSLSEEKLAELQNEYEDAIGQLRRLRDDKQREGEKIQADGLREIEKRLEPVIRKVREDGGYDLILNRVPGFVLMVKEPIDVTQAVMEAFDAAGGG